MVYKFQHQNRSARMQLRNRQVSEVIQEIFQNQGACVAQSLNVCFWLRA